MATIRFNTTAKSDSKEINSRNTKRYSLALLSGKGGAGKTVIALSMAKVLSKAGLNVLLVDLDIATHGATYFFELELENSNENISSIMDFFNRSELGFNVLKTKDGFDFLPSTTNLQLTKEIFHQSLHEEIQYEIIHLIKEFNINYDVIIFDCQAGYSKLVEMAAKESSRSLLVMEADAVSSAALRVLFLQIGEYLKSNRTWQIINKLTEDERVVYEKVIGGTFFTNLPPIPFDWQVRASFSTCNIPDVTSKESAFGLGVLRIMKTVFPDYSDKLNELESLTIGRWFEEILHKLEELEFTRNNLVYKKVEFSRKKRMRRFNLISITAMSLSITISLLYIFNKSIGDLFVNYLNFIWGALPIIVGILIFLLQSALKKEIQLEKDQDKDQEMINQLDSEINRYRTLIFTDPRLRDYAKLKGFDDKNRKLTFRNEKYYG